MRPTIRAILLTPTKPLFEDLFGGGNLDLSKWTITDTTPELLSNPGFETAGAGGADVFGSWDEAANSGSIVDEGTIVHGGSHACKLTSGEMADTIITQTITGLLASRQYTVSFWTRTAQAGDLAGRYYIYDVSNSGYITALTLTGISGTTYQQVSTTITTPVGCTSIRLGLQCASEFNYDVYFDDASITPVAAITVSGGKFRISGGKATAAWANPAAVSKAPYVWARKAGLTIEWQVTPGAANKFLCCGFTGVDNLEGEFTDHGLYLDSSGRVQSTSGAVLRNVITPFTYSAGQSLWFQIQCIPQSDGTLKGAKYSISTVSIDGPWTPIWIDNTVTTTPLCAFVESYNAALTSDGVNVYHGTVKPAVLSMTPGAPPLVAGTEAIINQVDRDFSGANNWTNGTFNAWDNTTGGVLSLTATAADQYGYLLGAYYTDFVVGGWYVFECDYTVLAAGGLSLVAQNGSGTIHAIINGHNKKIGRATTAWGNDYLQLLATGDTTSGQLDNLTLKPEPFDTTSLLTILTPTPSQHDGIYQAEVSPSAEYHQGIVCHADSDTAPANCLFAYYDRTAGKAYFLKQVAGVWTELQSATIAYAAGAIIEIISIGTSHAAYYNKQIVNAVVPSLDVSGWGLNAFYFATEGVQPLLCEAYA